MLNVEVGEVDLKQDYCRDVPGLAGGLILSELGEFVVRLMGLFDCLV